MDDNNMDGAKENVDSFSPLLYQQKGNKKNHQQQGRHNSQQLQKNTQDHPKKTHYQDQKAKETLKNIYPIIQDQTEMTTRQQQNNENIYPTIQSGEDKQNEHKDLQADNAMNFEDMQGKNQSQMHPRQQGEGRKHPEKNRQKEATELANNAAEKHANYYDGTLKSLCNTFPVQKSVSTYNRLKGTNESTEQTLNRIIQVLHTIDFGISFIVWRLFFYAKDISAAVTEKSVAKGNDFANWVSALSISAIILLSIGFVICSPVIFGSLIFIIPALFFCLLCLLIPAIFIVPIAFFFFLLVDLLPLPNKRAGSMTKNSFGKITIFNRGQKSAGKEGNEDVITSMAYQKTH